MICLHAGKYASPQPCFILSPVGRWYICSCVAAYPLLCGIFEADVRDFIYTPCSADAAHGATEMRPLRGQNRRNRNSKPPGCALANTASSTRKHGHLRYHKASLFIANTASGTRKHGHLRYRKASLFITNATFDTRKCTIYASSNTAFTTRKRAAYYGTTQESGRQSVTGKGRIRLPDW